MLAAAAAAGVPAQAQGPSVRTLEVPASAAWQHARTGLVLPPGVGGLERTRIRDTGQAELDILATFGSPDGDLIATLYLFRSQVPNAPLWFDRARTVIEQLQSLPVDTARARPVRGLALRSGASASGLMTAYPATGGGFSSTGLAVAPMNGWIVKLRMTSRTLDPAALEAKMAEWLAAVQWPAASGSTAQAATAIEDCPEPLSYKKVRVLRPSIEQAVLGSLFAVAATNKAPDPAARYCREPHQTVRYGAYRHGTGDAGYLLALADSGTALSVGPLMDLGTNKPVTGVTMLELGHTRVLPSFNRLPSPSQLIEALPKMQPVASVEVGTRTVDLRGDALEN